METHKVIIWLEDRPTLNKSVWDALEKSKHGLIVCENLKAFNEALQEYTKKADTVAGFVLDILVPGNDLAALGMPTVTTNGGNDTGIAVLRSYLRNIDGDAPDVDTWKNHKVLVLTSLSEAYCKSRYKPFLDWEQGQGDRTAWLSKSDEQGSKKKAVKEITQWVSSL